MNKKILVIPVLLLTFALISIQVMGAPATKIEGVTLTRSVTHAGSPPRWVDHSIRQMRGGTSTGTATLNIPGQDPLNGTWNSEWDNMVKFTQPAPDPEAEALIRAKVVLTFTGEGTTGTFEGAGLSKIIGSPPTVSTYSYAQIVLRGTGDFKAQTLKLSYERTGTPLPPEIWEGYLIIPK